jgi:hypothetical protein
MQASQALAFSDPASFGASPYAAGGGGRYFTGSPADGYTCKACHTGAAEPKLKVTGLPLTGYQPSVRYEIRVQWPADIEKLSLAVEVTDEQGVAVGSIRLPPDSETLAAEYCEPASDKILAASLNNTATQRQIVNMPDCGAKQLRFLWTAPATAVGAVWFSGSAVHSDGNSDPYHDGVTDFGRVITSTATASVATGECSVGRGAPGVAKSGAQPSLQATTLAAALALWFLRRRKSLNRI